MAGLSRVQVSNLQDLLNATNQAYAVPYGDQLYVVLTRNITLGSGADGKDATPAWPAEGVALPAPVTLTAWPQTYVILDTQLKAAVFRTQDTFNLKNMVLVNGGLPAGAESVDTVAEGLVSGLWMVHVTPPPVDSNPAAWWVRGVGAVDGELPTPCPALLAWQPAPRACRILNRAPPHPTRPWSGAQMQAPCLPCPAGVCARPQGRERAAADRAGPGGNRSAASGGGAVHRKHGTGFLGSAVPPAGRLDPVVQGACRRPGHTCTCMRACVHARVGAHVSVYLFISAFPVRVCMA